ncbi:MAG: methylglyoxal synthase [Firmicutes bacterium]|jgi:methylglyoxal synthase|nr:methylglyoxal synthase [Clostridiales bacterium]MBS6311078.1 methylglyoxal synthase [Bacillota bacterium]HCO51447.1 methylglyoxal synthase [Oscillibacter sp.]MCI6226708.1 methylglyoxal synthase [Clostridiales bacterium]MCI6613138.1 methylglyoxal synthase [Clostridiales bacterium]
MNIALIAHNNRKELMVQFCTAYCGILAKHTLCATATTGQMVAEATGLTIHRFMSFYHGGGQQIGARIAYNELDMVLCFDDPNTKEPSPDIIYISRLCDKNNIPYASNIATAEMLVLGLARGDLDWREVVNPKSNPFTA